jgi:hypothetical protein
MVHGGNMTEKTVLDSAQGCVADVSSRLISTPWIPA